MTLTNRIICGDNIEVLSQFEDEYFDATICSPPYDSARTYVDNAGLKWNFADFMRLTKQLYRVTKNGGVVVWVVGDQTIDGSESGTSFKHALYFMEIGFKLHDTMFYEKAGASYPASARSNRYSQVVEYMFVLSKGKPKTHNLIKDKPNRWAGFQNFGKATSRQVDGTLKEGKRFTIQDVGYRNNIWRIVAGKGNSSKDELAFAHPASYPEALARDHIISWTNEQDVVLDCFNGSGTTGVQAWELNRNFVGIDIAEQYCELYKERMKKRFDLDIEIEVTNGLLEQN